jgi:geranylgeranyl pyrophosphate synthase
MCLYKTGTLARMAARIASVLADADKDLNEKIGRFVESIGVAFQIQDDVLDLVGKEFAKKKGGLGQDITEGKRTLIVIRTLKLADHVDKRRLLEILHMHTQIPKLREEAINIIKKYDSINYAKEVARKLVIESWEEVDKLLKPSEARDKLREFAYYLIERSF